MKPEDKNHIFLLAQKLTGAHPEGTYQHTIFLTNVERRMIACGVDSLEEYLDVANKDPQEYAQLISSLSIHTTSWFRENPHYVIFQKALLDAVKKGVNTFEMWCCACSTGEEVYSFALVLEEFKRFHPKFNYKITGTDIDPISIEKAKKAIYSTKYLEGPVSYYENHILLGTGATDGLFTFSKTLRDCCEFKTFDIRTAPTNKQYDLIVCRNVLIYFSQDVVDKIITQIIANLKPGGTLILGHSEMIDYKKYGLFLSGHSVYQKPSPSDLDTKPITLPGQRERAVPPVIPNRLNKKPNLNFKPDVILIGASTGGPQALTDVIQNLPMWAPPVVVVQHIAKEFTKTFAERMSVVSALKLDGFENGCILKRGHIYFALDDYHLALQETPEGIRLNFHNEPPINGHRPSVDFLFYSAKELSGQLIAVLLTGMGKDGADGMNALHENVKNFTVAQSEQDSVVFGMPKEAINLGAVDFVGNAKEIRDILLYAMDRRK